MAGICDGMGRGVVCDGHLGRCHMITTLKGEMWGKSDCKGKGVKERGERKRAKVATSAKSGKI